MYRSGNPALSDATFEKSSYTGGDWWTDDVELMSMRGTSEKTAFLMLITAVTGIMTALGMPDTSALMYIGLVGGLIIALIVIFSGSMNPTLISLYAAFEGLFLGGITWQFELIYPGIGLQALLLTLLILGSMIAIYRANLISWDRNLAIAVYSSMSAIFLIYLITIIGSFVGFHVPYLHGNGPIGIAFSVFVIGIASLCLVADFDFIERGVERGAPKQLEWRAAFGLMVTLIWLYIEILRLLAKARSR